MTVSSRSESASCTVWARMSCKLMDLGSSSCDGSSSVSASVSSSGSASIGSSAFFAPGKGMTGRRTVSSAVSSTLSFAVSAFFGRGTTFAGGFFSAGGSGSFSSGSGAAGVPLPYSARMLSSVNSASSSMLRPVFFSSSSESASVSSNSRSLGSISFLLYRHFPRRWRTAS